MTTINATINGVNFGAAAKRIDIYHEGGGIGHWELKFDNNAGGSELLSTNLVASNLGINGTNFMQGYVDNVLPEISDVTAVFSKYATVKGRNYGRDLARLFIIKDYSHKRFDDLVADALSEADSEVTYSSSSNKPYVDAKFNKTFLQTGFVEAAILSGCDFLVDNSKAFQLWELDSAPDSGVLLKSVAGAADNNILLIDPETKAGVDIRNYIRVDAGGLNDHWTEGNATDWTGETGLAITDDFDFYFINSASIKVTKTGAIANLYYYDVKLVFPKYNHSYLDLTKVGKTEGKLYFYHDIPEGVTIIQVMIEDTEGNKLSYGWNPISPNKWFERIVPLGVDTTDQWHQDEGSTFNWQIVTIDVHVGNALGMAVDTHVWIDGLKIDTVPVWAYAEDATSIATYAKSMIPVNRTDIKSQVHAQAVADNELANRKDPIYKLKLTCTLQTGLLYSGYLVDVLAPAAHIGSGSTSVKYRILSLHHSAEPGVDLCRGHDAITELELIRHDGGVGADPTRFKLASAPQAAINARYDSRLRVLESSLSGSGNLLAGAGGGGVDWWNVPYIKVAGNSYFEADVSLSKKLIMVDPEGSENYIEFQVVMLEDPAFPGIYNPFLDVTEGFLVHKDVFTFGAFMTASPVGATGGGCIQIGDRFEHMSDPSRINLTGASDYLALTKGSTIQLGYENHDVDRVLTGLRCAGINVKGHILPIGSEKNLGSETAPWNDIFSLYAHIGNVTVSNNLYVNAVNTVSEANLPVNLSAGKKVVVNGDLEVTGSIIGGGVGDVYWDDILGKPYTFPPSSHTHDASDAIFTTVLCTNGTGSVKCGSSSVNVALSLGYDGSNGYLTAHSKNLVINAVSGVINMQNDTNFAGLINIRGGAINIQTSGGTNRVQFGHDGSNAYLTSLSGLLTLTGSGGIWLYGGNVSLRGGYHFIPESANGGQLGNNTYYWYASYVNNVYGKNPYTFGCERDKSNQEWLRKFTTREACEERLTHEVTKNRRHTHYDPNNESKIICTCGKSVTAPCPEHEAEWNDLYAVHLGDCVEASSFLVLEWCKGKSQVTGIERASR